MDTATGVSPAITVFLADDNLLVREGVLARWTSKATEGAPAPFRSTLLGL